MDAIKLTDEHKRMLRALDADIEWVRGEIARAKGVGIDTQKLEHELERGVRLRDNLLKEYG